MADLEKLAEELSNLSIMEAAQLVKILEEKWGVSAAAPVAVAAAAPGAAPTAEEAQAEEKTEFDVVIKDIGPKRLQVIRVVRQLTNLDLKAAKQLAETPGAKVLEGVSKDEAEAAKAKLEEAGAVVEIV